MPEMFNESQIKGIKCELDCAIKFIEKGFIVSVPYGNTSRYDLLIDAGNGKYFRIQCKTAHQNENGSYTIDAFIKTLYGSNVYFKKESATFEITENKKAFRVSIINPLPCELDIYITTPILLDFC